jgi:hypothetical protein
MILWISLFFSASFTNIQELRKTGVYESRGLCSPLWNVAIMFAQPDCENHITMCAPWDSQGSGGHGRTWQSLGYQASIKCIHRSVFFLPLKILKLYQDPISRYLFSNLLSAGHGSRAVWGMHCLRSLVSRDHGFESHSGHGCLMCVCVFLCLCCPVFR